MSDHPSKKQKNDHPVAKVFGMCNPLLDISADVDASMLKKYDLKPATAILAEPKHLPIYAEISTMKPEYIAGGAGQNSIRVCQWMLHDNPNSTYYVGCVGKDEYGKTLRSTASADGVNVQYMEVADVPTGTCACLICDKERTLIANLSAAEKYQKSHFESDAVKKVLDDSSIFYVTGFFLTHSTDSAVALGEYSAKHKKTFTFNLAAPFVCEYFKDNVMKVLPYADVIFGNESEAHAFGKAMGFGDDLREIAQKTQAMERSPLSTKKRVVIFTQGAEETIVVDENGKIHQFTPIAISKDKIVDSNGAGDAFVGGFLAGQALGKPLAKSIHAAFYSAWEILQVHGTKLKGRPCNFKWD